MNLDPLNLIIKTQAGLEELLAQEVAAAGAGEIQILKRAVKCTADKATLYRLNYTCRTALRVLKEIAAFEAPDEQALYQGVKNFDWSSLISEKQSLAINATVSNSQMSHSHFVSLKTKDAIVDQFREKTGLRPNVDLDKPDLRIHVHIYGEQCSILTDSSGDSLHKRGYRTMQGLAPINEVLASGMIMHTGWDGSTDLLDPLCGSGTLLCEADMIARKIPAGFFREDYGFFRWNDFDAQLWKKIVKEENSKIRPVPCNIFGSDINQRALALAAEVIENADFTKDIQLKHVAFENSKAPVEGGGTIITNPPYGERIKKDDLNAFYKMIGDILKTHYTGWDAWMISSDFSALKSVGLRTSRKIHLFNGPLECRFVKYEMYRGSKKTKAEKAEEEG